MKPPNRPRPPRISPFPLILLALLIIPPAHSQSATEAVIPALTHEAANTLAGGRWFKKDYDIHGKWAIVAHDGKRYLVFDDDFQTRRGPDLKVYLSTRPLTALSDRTVAPNSREIAPLKSFRGAQEYELPPDLVLADYRSVLIHCKRYSHLWGGGAIAIAP